MHETYVYYISVWTRLSRVWTVKRRLMAAACVELSSTTRTRTYEVVTSPKLARVREAFSLRGRIGHAWLYQPRFHSSGVGWNASHVPPWPLLSLARGRWALVSWSIILGPGTSSQSTTAACVAAYDFRGRGSGWLFMLLFTNVWASSACSGRSFISTGLGFVLLTRWLVGLCT
jgi:hypothetical protein